MRADEMNIFRTISERHELVSNLVSRELKSKYKGSVLGFLWSILTPLFMAVIYVVFLRLLAGRGIPVENIIIGVFAWQFTSLCVTGGMNCVTGSSNLVKKVYFPRIILPLANTLANLVNFLLSLAVQFVILFILLGLQGSTVSVWALALPVLIVYHTLFNLALALLMASSNVYFRDTQHLVGVLLSAWFFMSPVMYDLSFVQRASQISPLLANLYMLNPAAVMITGYRAMTMPAEVFPWTPYSIAGLFLPLVLLGIAYVVFQRSEKNFADML